MVTRGRILLAVERYKNDTRRAKPRSAGQMMTILTEFGVDSRIEEEDYLQSVAALRKAWRFDI